MTASRSLRQAVAGFALLFLAACASTPKGAFVKPVDGQVTSWYGQRGRSTHTGVDIGADRGTDVRAAKDGKVVFRGRRGKYGRLVIIDHGDGVQTYYAHLSGYNTRKGRKVRRGQTIGRVGKSGRATGYHLHFELRIGGRPIDPRGVVPF